MSKADVGVVGLGRMGLRMVEALRGAGLGVLGGDNSPAARATAAERGIAVGESLAALTAQCRTILLSLPSGVEVEDVVQELASSVTSGTHVVDMSTCAPAVAARMAALLRPLGATFIDCPVSGRPPTMTVFVGGRAADLGPAGVPIAAIADHVMHIGRLGGGYQVKLLNQHLKYTRFVAASEALAFAEREGFALDAVVDGLRAGTGAEAGLASAEELFVGDEAAVARRAPLQTIVKDLALVADMFSAAESNSTSLDAASLLYSRAAGAGLLDQPYPHAADLLRTAGPAPERHLDDSRR